MRKTTKLLTILLTLALLCGLVSIVASAAVSSENKEMLTADGAYLYSAHSSDFEDDGVSIDYDGPAGSVNANTGHIGEWGGGNRTGYLKSITSDGNTYVRYYHYYDVKGSDNTTGYYALKIGDYTGTSSGYYSVLNHDTVVVDFEISADQYLKKTTDSKGEVYYELTEENTGLPSYADMSLAFYARYINASGGNTIMFSKAPIRICANGKDTSYFRITPNISGDLVLGTNGDYKLPTEAGVWTHITYVFDLDNSVNYADGTTGKYDPSKVDEIASLNLSKSRLHIYINGEWFFSMKFFEESADKVGTYPDLGKIGLDQIRISPNAHVINWAGPGIDYSDYSVALDNVATNYYSTGNGGDIETNIKKDYKQPIYNYSNVVYRDAYKVPAPNAPVGTVDGKEYYIEKGMFAAIKEGSTISLNKDIVTPCLPDCAFTVQTNGYDFSLDVASEYLMVKTSTAGKYEIRLATDADKATITWDTEGGLLYAVTTPVGGAIPAHPTKKVGDLIIVDGVAKILEGWAVTPAGSAIEIPVAVAGACVTYYPVYTDVAWIIYRDGEIDTIGTVANDVARIFDNIRKRDVTYDVVLYADVDLWDGGNSSYFKTPQNTTLNIDLNGYTISRLSHDNKGNVATIANPDSHVKIYSSRPGAKIFNASLTTSNGVVNGGAVVSAGGQNSSATFGNGTNNLSIYTAILVDAAHYLSRGTAETTKNIVKINIDGGLYVRSHADSYALIIARDDVEINFKNATIASTTGPIISRDNRYNGSITGTIDNCKLSSAKIVEQIDDSAFTITNSILSGGFVASDESKSGGKVYLGDGTKHGMSLPANVAIADGAIAFGKTETVTFNWTTYNFAYDKTTNEVLASSIVPVSKSDTVNVIYEIMDEERAPKKVTVYWYTNNGIPLGSQTAYEGEEVVFSGEYPETRVNGWFVSGIAGWSNTPGGEASSTVVSQSNCRFYAVLGYAIDVQFLHNLTTTTNFTRNVYLPVPAEDSGIVITGVYSGTDVNGTNLYGAYRCDPTKAVSINGAKYIAIVDWPGANNNGASTSYTVTYTYNGVAASAYVKTPSFVDYFTQVLEDEDMDEESRTLVVNIANYLKAIATYAKLSFAGQYDELLIQYSEYILSDVDEIIAADAAKNPANVSGLSSYVTGATFVIGVGYRPMFGFVPVAGVEKVTVTLNSNAGGIKNYNVTKPTNNNWGSDKNILVNNMDIPVYDIRQTITITSADGKATGTYNLAAYITWMEGEVENNTAKADANALAVAKALYAYSVASYEYKTRNAGK